MNGCACVWMCMWVSGEKTGKIHIYGNRDLHFYITFLWCFQLSLWAYFIFVMITARKIHFYNHFEQSHCVSPHRHTILQPIPQLIVRHGAYLSFIQQLHYNKWATIILPPEWLKWRGWTIPSIISHIPDGSGNLYSCFTIWWRLPQLNLCTPPDDLAFLLYFKV